MTIPKLSKIRIYPIKALDPIELDQATIGHSSLLNDRVFAMTTADGEFMNGKRTGKVNELKAIYDLENRLVTLSLRDNTNQQTFELNTSNTQLTDYLSDFFGMKVNLVNSQTGTLMDVPQKSAITIISRASLESLQKDMPNYTLEELRLRFRANLEIDGVEAFWEETLFGDHGDPVQFKIGETCLVGMGPRERCSVPPKHPFTGKFDLDFTKAFLSSRKKSLPKDSKLPQFRHLYHLAVDVFISESEKGKSICLGDKLMLKKVQ